MPNKHIIFLVHGMGDFKDLTWSKSAQDTLANLYAAYKPINAVPFDQLFEFQPVLYNDEFEALRTMWSNSAASLGTAIAGSGISSQVVSDLDSIAGATKKSTFINTHVLDVLLYRFARQTAAPVRETVRNQIFSRLNQLSATEPRNWSIIAHSLGTAVVHDALHEAYSEAPNADRGNLAGITRPTLLAMIANVGRVLETDADVYESRVRPGNPNDPDAACRYYLNAVHKWDPFPQPKAFRPALQWPSIGVRQLKPPLFLDIQISEIEQLNVHDFNHYLRNPLIHCPIFNCLLDQIALDPDPIEAAHAQFAAHTPLAQFGNFVSQLKPFQLGEEDVWKDILASWSQFLKL